MTVETTSNNIEYDGNDSTTVFPFNFPFFNDSEIFVSIFDSNGVETPLTQDIDYTLPLGEKRNGGQINYPISGSPLPTNYTLIITRELPLTQTASIRNQGRFNASVHETVFDKLIMILQQYLNKALNRFGGNNKMLQDIDMNNHRILNLPVPGGDTEPLRKGDITSDLTGATVLYVDDKFQVTTKHSPNLLDARSRTDVENGMSVRLSGRNSIGDGGDSVWGYFPAGTFPVGASIYDVYDHDSLPLQVKLRNSETANAKQFGLVLDGVTDDSDAFIAWANGTTKPESVFGTARITKEILITTPWVYKPGNSFKIFPDLGVGQVRVLAFETDDVDIEFSIDADGGDFVTVSTGNKYAVYSGKTSGATKYKNHTIKVKVDNWLYSDGNTGSSNLIVSHALYSNNVDRVTYDYSVLENTSGAGYFVRDCTTFSSVGVKFKNNGWYPLNLESGVEGGLITLCDCDQLGLPNGVFWGGGLNIQSQQAGGGVRNKNIVVYNNKFKGFYSYGSVIRVNSCSNVVIELNQIEDVEVGAVTLAADLTGIRVDTRGISTAAQNGPCEQITIHNNFIKAGLTGANKFQAIYASNQWQSARFPFKGLFITDNHINSVNTSRYWSSAIILHGFEGGFQHVTVRGNHGETYMQASPVVDGAIGFVGNNSNGTVRDVYIGSNSFVDLGTPTSSYQLGIGIGGFVDEFYVTGINTMDNYFYGVRTFTNSGPTLEDINDIRAPNVGSLETLYAVLPSRFKDLGQVMVGTRLSDISDSINTQNKWEGKKVFDSTANKPVYATGSNPNSTWNDGAGANTHSPS